MEPEIYNWTSRSLAMSRKAIAMKLLKEKWLSMVQSAREKGENGIGGSSIVTNTIFPSWAMSWHGLPSPSTPASPYNKAIFPHPIFGLTVTHKIVPIFCNV